MQDAFQTFAFGVELRLTTASEGGRSSPLSGDAITEARFAYRANWGLPGVTAPGQTGAPVLAFSQEPVEPGDEVRAVIVVPYPQTVPDWAAVEVGDVLPMYEGSRVCGHGRIAWRRQTLLPLPAEVQDAFMAWIVSADRRGAPDE